MRYLSTRDTSIKFTAAQAIRQGLANDGGLFTPEMLPNLNLKTIGSMVDMNYIQRAVYILGGFLEEFSVAELTAICEKAYLGGKFDTPEIAPVKSLDDTTHFLELWHGPTCAFKDMALQALPHLLTSSIEKCGERRTVCILVATSGDTGKAAMEGFCDVEGTKILVFYPKDGVSAVQELQMTSQKGKNVGVCAVYGNFDDAQTGVKKIFTDEELRRKLDGRGYFLSSANSINWGRVLPQVVYYISAYCDLVKQGKIELGDKINFCVPTGNFGNILAGYYAKSMGLPVNRLICASNMNNVLTDFINIGVYNRNRPFYTTISPSMDILVSSNLERLLYDMCKNPAEVAGYMKDLAEKGEYAVSGEILDGIRETFSAGYCTETNACRVIKSCWDSFGYLIDPHTADAFEVLLRYRARTGDATPTVVVSTASPYKFCDSVLKALDKAPAGSGVGLIDQLFETTGVPVPAPIMELKDKKRRFNTAVEKERMAEVVQTFLK